MKTLYGILAAFSIFLGGLLNISPLHQANHESGSTQQKDQRADAEMFEKAVTLIKKYETLHQPRHWPLVGYGHMVLPGEKFSRTAALSEKTADALLRKDLLKNCAVFRQYGADSLILGVLAYNIGSGNVRKSSLVKKLAAGDRNIEQLYLSYSKYRGKTHSGLRKRRTEEFNTLFLKDSVFSSVNK